MAISSTLIKSFQLSTLATALALAGCGGGSGNDTLQPGLPTGTNPMPSPGNGTGTNPAPGNGTGTNPAPGNGTGTNPTKPAQKFDVKAVNLTSPTPTFDIKVGNKINVTASVLNSANTGIGGVPVVFEIIEDPAKTGVYAISDTNNIITNANGEATIQLEVKSEEFATKLSQGLTIKATAQNNSGDKLVPISQVEPFKLLGKVVETNTPSTNIAQQVKNIALTSPTPEFDFVVGQKITVTATATNENGGIVSNAPINFDLGSLADTGVVSTSPSTRNTDAQGQATIELEVKDASQAMRNKIANGLLVKAAVEGSTLPPKTLTLKPRTVVEDTHKTVNSITVKQDSPLYLAKGSKVKISAFALNDFFGGLAGKQLTFRLDKNPEISGVYNNSNSIITTLANGEATVELEVKTDLTTAQKNDLKNDGIKITVSDVNGTEKTLQIKGEEASQAIVDKVTLTANINAIPLTVGSQFTVTATVSDAQNGGLDEIPISVTVPSLADYGIVNLSGSTVTTNVKGQATLSFRVESLTESQKSKILDPKTPFTITATANGKSAPALTIKGIKEVTVADIAKVNVTTNLNTLTGQLGETINITAQIHDKDGNALNNLPVNFSIDDTNATGYITKTALNNVITNENGEATLKVEASALSKEQLYYLQTSGLTINATSGNIIKTITLHTKEVPPVTQATSLLLTPEFDKIKVAVGNKVKVTALVFDKDNNIVANTPVSLTGLAGTGLVNNSGAVLDTNANGEATFELEIKDLTLATPALQRGVKLTAQSGSVAIDTKTLTGAASNASTEAYKFFMTQSKDIMNTATDKVTVSVRVTDINGGIKANVPVYLQLLDDGANYGLSFSTPSKLTTNANGIATFDVVQSDIGLAARLNHHVKFKAIVNDGVYKTVEQTIEIPIQGTRVENINLNKTQLLPTDTFNITKGTLVDGNGKPLANTPIELVNNSSTSSLGITTNTDAQGNFAFNNVAISRFATNPDGTVNIAAKIGTGNTVQTVDSIAVLNIIAASNTSIAYQGSAQNLIVNQFIPITINTPNLSDNTVITISTTKGTVSLTNTPSAGSADTTRIQTKVLNKKATVYLYSKSPGEAKLTVQTVDQSGINTILKEDNVNFVSILPTKLALQLEKTVVSTNGYSKVIAKVLDAHDAPVKNAIVSFSILSDPSSGSLNNATVLTDAAGQAIISYNAGAVPSPVNGVKIQATVNSLYIYDNQAIPVETPITLLSALQNLTVQTFASTIGVSFADRVSASADSVYYLRNGSVFIVNSVGQPAANTPVSIKVIPTVYYKGYWAIIKDINDKPLWAQFKNNYVLDSQGNYTLNPDGSKKIDSKPGTYSCDNEDTNRNGFMDPGEDVNQNGQLDPINPATILSPTGEPLATTQTIMTDATGKLDFKVRYPKQYSEWLDATVTVSTKVDGTESIQSTNLTFPPLADDVVIGVPLRPNWYSPLGTFGCTSKN